VLWIAVASVAGCAGGAEPGDSVLDTAVATAPVTRQDLTVDDELAGWLGHRDPVPLVAGRDGVLTWMPEEGAVVQPGQAVAEIDGAATRLLVGDRPAWRRMAVGEQDGPDIAQLNANLAALGYAERDALPDERFDWRTRQAVHRWQDTLGLKRTGAVELGDVVFLPSEVRIGSHEVLPGAWVGTGQALATATGTQQVVTVGLDPGRRASLPVGAPVVVVLPDRTSLDGTVSSVGRTVTGSGAPDGEPTVEVEVELGGGALAPVVDFDTAPVVVEVERVLAEDVLVVPVGALLALADRGYAVERVTAGATELVAVEPGRFADGLVEVTGDIAEGDDVVVPS
jgi:peptidoglycan hydrolase-like protein with peptidoglycan-binding domain